VQHVLSYLYFPFYIFNQFFYTRVPNFIGNLSLRVSFLDINRDIYLFNFKFLYITLYIILSFTLRFAVRSMIYFSLLP